MSEKVVVEKTIEPPEYKVIQFAQKMMDAWVFGPKHEIPDGVGTYQVARFDGDIIQYTIPLYPFRLGDVNLNVGFGPPDEEGVSVLYVSRIVE